MKKDKYNAISGQPIYVPNPRYLELVETLLNRKLSYDENDFAPKPTITIYNYDNYARPLPGVLSSTTDIKVFAEVGRLLGGGMVADWSTISEDERIPLIESAIKARDTQAGESTDEWSEAKSPAEWNKELGISDTTRRRWKEEGKLEVEVVSLKLWRIRLDSLERCRRKPKK